MRFRVRHITTYRYSEPVLLSHHAAHLHPRGVPGQRQSGLRLRIRPTPAVLREGQQDYFGNPTTFFTIQDAHTMLEVEAGFAVETSAVSCPAIGVGPVWTQVRDDLAEGGHPNLEAALDFLFPSAQVPALAEARDFALPSFPPGRPIAEAVLDLCARIHTQFAFDPAATAVGTPLTQVFFHRRGVCQDFAHVGIACLRSLGLAARYVSGYIRTLPPPGREKLIGADASHAWLSVFIPDWGWLDIDPTNNTIIGEDHVTVAWGRDYDDVSPLRGVVLGGGEHKVIVAVDVFELG